MKKRIPKVFAVALSAAMLASLSATTAFAANTVITNGQWNYTTFVAGDPNADPPTADDNGTAALTANTITVTNVDDIDPNDANQVNNNFAVTAYQIVKGQYKDGKLTGYVLCDPTNAPIADMAAPTAAEITTIASRIKANTTTLNGIVMTKSADPTTTFTANVEAGLYVVIVSNAMYTMYNPAIVAVNVTDANLLATPDTTVTPVDMASFFNTGSNAYMKKTKSGITKSIVKDNNTVSGDFVKYGDTVNFKIDNMTIPSYSPEYTGTVKYDITDNLSATAFAGISDFTLTLGGEELAASVTENEVTTTHYELTYMKGNVETDDVAKATGFVVSFKSAYIKSLANKTDAQRAVVITYKSTIADTADINFAENKNSASLSYTNDPGSDTGHDEDTYTYHYTFGISANIDAQGEGEGQDVPDVPNPFYKVDSNDAELDPNTWEIKDHHALAGAEFTLYTDEAMTATKVANWAKTNTATKGVAASDANGQIEFKGLMPGTYYMKETKAPAGYSLTDKEYKIVIAANLNNDGTLHDYSISTFEKVNGAYSNAPDSVMSFTCTYTIDGEGNVKNNIAADLEHTDPTLIVNTTLAELPNTGGIGTIIITVVAALGMGLFLTLFIVSRKKKSSSEK